MLKIEEVKKEYFRIEKLLKKEALTGDDYNSHCEKGFSVFWIKKDLNLTWNGMKKVIGAKMASNATRKGGVKKSSEILCNRDGSMITRINCVPGCNDACLTCENKQMQNTQAGSDTLTPEGHKEQTLSGTYRSSAAIAVEDGYFEK